MTRRIQRAPQEKGAFERHAQSLVATVILAVVLYTGNTMQEIKEQASKTAIEVAIFQKSVAEKIASLENQLGQLQTSVTRAAEDRFRGTDATAAFAVRDTKISDLEMRLRKIENDHAALLSKSK